jgi:hypothetical protein
MTPHPPPRQALGMSAETLEVPRFTPATGTPTESEAAYTLRLAGMVEQRLCNAIQYAAMLEGQRDEARAEVAMLRKVVVGWMQSEAQEAAE